MRPSTPSGGAPGGYQDPDDPVRLRHWNGRSWSGRRRARPAWTIASERFTVESDTAPSPAPDAPVLEGPVRPPALPAAAASSSGTIDAAGPAATWATPSSRQRRPAGVAVPRGPTRAGPPGLAPAAPSWSAPRRPLVIFTVLALVAVVIMVVNIGLSRPANLGSVAFSDPPFVTAANADCTATLTGIRRGQAASTATATTSAATTPAAAAAAAATAATARATTIDHDADVLDGLASRLAVLPMSSGPKTVIKEWLAGWHAYVADQHAYALLVRGQAKGGSSVALQSSRLASQARQASTQADNFALTNGLKSCTIVAPPAGSELVSF